jgi:hypothetical protein
MAGIFSSSVSSPIELSASNPIQVATKTAVHEGASGEAPDSNLVYVEVDVTESFFSPATDAPTPRQEHTASPMHRNTDVGGSESNLRPFYVPAQASSCMLYLLMHQYVASFYWVQRAPHLWEQDLTPRLAGWPCPHARREARRRCADAHAAAAAAAQRGPKQAARQRRRRSRWEF